MAALHVFIDGKDTEPLLRFNWEDRGWRFDLIPTLQQGNAGL